MSALAGAVLGIGLFLAIRPALAAASLTGTRYFAATVTPTAWGYLGMLVAVPAASAIASLAALRRVRISPLGVSRRVAPPPPVGVAARHAGRRRGAVRGRDAGRPRRSPSAPPPIPGLLVTMIGLVIAGPWLTAAAARLVCAGTERRVADAGRAAARRQP